MRRALLACLAAALALPASAGAATVRLEDEFDQRSNTTSQEVVYDALSGEANDLRATYDGSRFYDLTDPAGITPGRGCTRPNPLDATRARCEVTAGGGTSGITVNGGDRNDIVRIDGVGAILRGGDGNDALLGPDFGSRFEGGKGDDLMIGGDSTDLFEEGPARNGADAMRGSGNVDEVSYRKRRGKIRADLQGDRDDGEPGERDQIDDDVEDLTGGRANDRLTGNVVDNTLRGGRGSDVIDGGGGDDELAAQLDTFEPGRQRSRDRIRGGSGRDTIGGSAGSNRLSGGPSPDVIHAGRGNDRISARDGRLDRIACGRGRDRARLDGVDYFADRCERVRRSFLPAAVPLDLGSSGRHGGTAFVEVGCPRDAPRRCRGRVLLEDLGSRRFRIRHGRQRRIAIELPERSVPLLRRGGATLDVIVRSLDARGRIREIETSLELPAF